MSGLHDLRATGITLGAAESSVRRDGDISSVVIGKGIATVPVKVMDHGSVLGEFEMPRQDAQDFAAWAAARRADDATAGTEPAASTSGGIADELAKLAKLRDDGILDDAEFAAQKAKLLD